MASAIERVILAQPLATAGQRVIASPFQFATTEDDNLRIVSANSLAGVVLAIQGRRVTTAGNIEPFAFVHTPNSDRSSRTENYKLGAGALMNLVIFAVSGSPVIGQTFVSAQIIRGLSAATILLGGLLGGYVTAAQPLAYPGSPIQSSIEGGGFAHIVFGTDPAAGVEISETVPTGARWQVISFLANIGTSAAAGNRRPSLVQAMGVFTIHRSLLPSTAPPSSSVNCLWAQGQNFESTPDAVLPTAGFPIDLVLPAGSLIYTSTTALAAGDNWAAPQYAVREWLEVQA